jgi:hypothetical protein
MKAKRTVSSQKILEGMKTKVIASFSFDHKKKKNTTRNKRLPIDRIGTYTKQTTEK